MKKEILEKRILEKAKFFKSRARNNPECQRHDSPKSDEKKEMYTAYHELGWSYAKIGGLFKRDPRTVEKAVIKKQVNIDKKKKDKQLADLQLIQQRQKEHVKVLQHIARTALDCLPLVQPDLETAEPDVFYAFNEGVVMAYQRLIEDGSNWKDLASHLGGDEGNRIELMNSQLDEFPGGSLLHPNLTNYNKVLEEAWLLIRSGGVKTISESSDTMKWEEEGLIQRCKNCPDKNYVPVEFGDEDERIDPMMLKMKFWKISKRQSS